MTAIQKSVPALRFQDSQGRDYPDWEKVKFKYLYSFKTTNSFPRNKLNYGNGKVRNLHYGDIHTKYQSIFELDRENVPFLNLDINLNYVSEDAYCKEGDLVIADASEDHNGIGKTIELLNLNGESVLAGLHTLLAKRNSDRIHIGYGAYVMACNIVRQQIMKIAQGTKVLGISVGRMNEIELPIPSKKEEQQKIVAFLSSVDTKIKQLTQKKALLEQYKKGMMQKLFSQQIRFKDEKGRDYPGWKEYMLDSVFSERIERGHVEKEMLSVTISNGVVRTADLDRHNNRPANTSKYKKVNIGDLAYNSMRMWQGANGMSEYEGVISPAYTVLIPKPNQHSKFWGFYFKTSNVIHLFQRNSQGLTSDTWNLKFPALSRIKLLVPNKKEQQKIADFLSAIDGKIKLVTGQIKQAQAFKKGLLQQMFI